MEKPQPEGESSSSSYRNRDRYGMAVALTYQGRRRVADGPKYLAAFSGETVRWKLINSLDRAVTFEFRLMQRLDAFGPDDPFYGDRTVQVQPGQENKELSLRITADWPAINEMVRYEYEIRILDEPGTSLDSELDIWP